MPAFRRYSINYNPEIGPGPAGLDWTISLETRRRCSLAVCYWQRAQDINVKPKSTVDPDQYRGTVVIENERSELTPPASVNTYM